jgi:hypothetical protein
MQYLAQSQYPESARSAFTTIKYAFSQKYYAFQKLGKNLVILANYSLFNPRKFCIAPFLHMVA